jgi:hypothetical protein
MHGNASVMFGDNFTLEQALEECKQGRDKINGFIADIYKEMKQQAPSPRNMKDVLFPIVRDFHVIVKKHLIDQDLITLGLLSWPTMIYNETPDMFTVLVDAGCFESKSQARKNWNGIKEVPTGYSEIGPIGKGKLFLFIWNPTE